jgi:hypothetical protein
MIEFWIEIIAHTSLFLIFLPIFYFYYVVPLQSYTMVDDLFQIIQPELVDLTLLSTLNDTRNLNKVIELLNSKTQENEELSQEIGSIQSKNAHIFQITNAIFYTLGCVLFATAIGLSIYYDKSLIEMILSSIIVLSFIMISEFAIVGLFFKNFKQLNANFVKATVAQNLVNTVEWWESCDYTYDYFSTWVPSSILRLFT